VPLSPQKNNSVAGGRAGVAAAQARAPTPAFLDPPATPYPVEAGAFSAHGYQALPLLQSMMARNDFHDEHYGELCGWGGDKKNGERKAMKHTRRLLSHLPASIHPSSPLSVATTVSFFKQTPGHLLPLPTAILAKHATGAKHPDLAITHDGADALPKVAPLVARFGGTPRLQPVVEAATAALQASPASVACASAAAAVLERIVVLGEGVREAVAAAAASPAVPLPGRAWLKAGLDAADAGAPDLGVAGDDDDSAPAALVSAVAVAAAPGVAEAYEAGVLAGAARGGDAAVQRAHLVGAWLAGRAAVVAGRESGGGDAAAADPARPAGAPPAAWRAKATKVLQLEAMTHALLYQRGARLPFAMAGEEVPGAEAV
jgi:hypothetical protein